MMLSRAKLLVLLTLGAIGIGCTPAATTPGPKPQLPTGPITPPAPVGSATTPVSPQPEPADAAAATIVAPPPPNCTEFAARSGNETPKPEDCPADDAARLIAVDAALAESDAVERDRKLLRIESCVGYEPGLLRALRADLAPAECADAIAESLLKNPPSGLSTEVSQVLRGLTLGARLRRASDQPPRLEPPFTREKFQAFLGAKIRPWYWAQSKVVFDMAATGSRLSGYGKAIVAIEAGLSDLRFVENVRRVELPTDMRNDPEVVEVYQQALEDALEPRKIRGRDAILVGLLHLGQLGVLDDPRFWRARSELGKLFAGSRIDALDPLLLPQLPAPSQATVIERLAAKLPSFYADRLLQPESVNNPEVLRALLERGLPPKLRQQIEKATHESPTLARLFARGQLELGRRYFRPADFARASVALEGKGVLAGPAAGETRLVAALSHALEGGPENAVQLMLTGPMLPKGMGNIAALERLAHEGGNVAGMSAFNAGHLLSIIPQEKPAVEHWQKVARYFDVAERRLTAPAQKSLAHARAQDARETAEHVRGLVVPPQ